MMKRHWLICGVLLLFSSNLFATKSAQVSIDSLLLRANKVAFVTVTQREIADTNTACGVVYSGIVTAQIKNTHTNEKITFCNRFDNRSDGLRIAKNYILFLNDYNGSAPYQAIILQVTDAGYSAQWVGVPFLVDFDDDAKIPAELPSQTGHSADTEASQILWHPKKDVLAYLRKKLAASTQKARH